MSLGLAPPGRGNLAKGTPCLSSLASRKTHDPSVGYTFVAHNWFYRTTCGRASVCGVDVDGRESPCTR